MLWPSLLQSSSGNQDSASYLSVFSSRNRTTLSPRYFQGLLRKVHVQVYPGVGLDDTPRSFSEERMDNAKYPFKRRSQQVVFGIPDWCVEPQGRDHSLLPECDCRGKAAHGVSKE